MSDKTPETGGEAFFNKEVDAALRDTVVLLEFLGRASDGRLQAQFQDTRDQVTGSSAKKTSPPCKNYHEFLNRLSIIQGRYRTENDRGQDWLFEPPKGGDPALTDCAFVLWSRDFLAGVSAPATADTVRLTEAYMERRADGLLQRLWKWPTHSRFCPPSPPRRRTTAGPPPPPPAAITVERAAAQLARRVGCLEYLATFVTVVTVGFSIYALSGRLIVAARDDTITQYRQIEQKITDIESHTSEPILVSQHLREAVTKAANGGQPGGKFYLCDDVDTINLNDHPDARNPIQNVPSFGPISSNVFFEYGSYEAIDICRQRKRLLTQLFALGEQILSWQRVFTGHWPMIGSLTDFNGKVFGKNDDVMREFSNNPLICSGFAGIKDVGTGCQAALTEIAEYYGRIPDSILGCITLYVLPCLYALLGSIAATMRYLRVRVDTYEISFTDRGRILQNIVLGVIAGAIVGLFSAYLSKSSAVENIGVAALACLAGYNVSGLFRFLDDLSDRVFRVAAPTGK